VNLADQFLDGFGSGQPGRFLRRDRQFQRVMQAFRGEPEMM